jgi:hypothetical protein
MAPLFKLPQTVKDGINLVKLNTENRRLRHLLIKEMTDKPGMNMGSVSDAAIVPKRYQYTYTAYYDLYVQSIILRTVIKALSGEIFRRKGHWVPRFKRKCMVCGEEYEYVPETDACEMEGCLGQLREPDETGRDEVNDFLFQYKGAMGQVNNAGQTLWKVLKQFENDLDIADDAYLVISKEYEVSRASGQIVTTEVREIVRAHPDVMHIIADSRGNLGGLYKVCPIHRGQVKDEKDQAHTNCPL